MEDVTAAAIGFMAEPGRVEENLSRIRRIAGDAAAKGAELVCFPELAVTGYSLPEALDLAEDADGRIVSSLKDISEEHGICISAGFVESEGGKKYISQALAEDGRLLGIYRKTHLGHRERTLLDAGDSLPVFETSFGKVAICLCWESRFPEIHRVLALKGAEIILLPYASGPGGDARRGIWQRYLPARAADSTVFLVACNMLREGGGGGAAILDFRGDVLGEDYSANESTVICGLSSKGLSDARRGGTMKDNFYLSERRPDLYGDILSRNYLDG